MARLVTEIMNSEVFSLAPEDRASDALGFLLAFGISGAPVIDSQGRPLGVVSHHELMNAGQARVAERMRAPALTVRDTASVEEVGRSMALHGAHRLVVVDETGRSVGLVSALDVVCGLSGLPARHPAAFPHLDHTLGVSWTDAALLEAAQVDSAPEAPGVLQLLDGGLGRPERVMWTEATPSLRSRVLELLSTGGAGPLALAELLLRPNLRFRAAATTTLAEARGLVVIILDAKRQWPQNVVND